MNWLTISMHTNKMKNQVNSWNCIDQAFAPGPGVFKRKFRFEKIEHPQRKEDQIMRHLAELAEHEPLPVWRVPGGFVDGCLQIGDNDWMLVEHKETLHWNSFREALSQLMLARKFLTETNLPEISRGANVMGLIVYERCGSQEWEGPLLQWMLNLAKSAIGMPVGILCYQQDSFFSLKWTP